MSTTTRFTGLATTGIVLGLATIGLTGVNAQADSMSDYDNVLQSVSIAVDSSGTIQSVSDRSVGLSADDKGINGDTEKRDFNPEEVASELPVRVSVYYRGDWGEGFDLSEIAGHSGQVEVTLWVQNLTTSAEKLTPNVGGVSSPRSVLVSAPLTVIASTHLPETVHVLSNENLLAAGDISEEAVDGNDVRNTGTNGVILREENGTTLQWASLLASPYTPGLASFSVVMSGDNLPVPEFNVAVQKGFLTQGDPSDFVASSFSSTDTDTETLVYQAVELSSRLADILERTESMISDTRAALNSSQSTIGQATIRDLQEASRSLISSTQSMQSDFSKLNSDISANMGNEYNNSSTLGQIRTVTTNMEAILGKESDFQAETSKSEKNTKECEALEINLSPNDPLSKTLNEVSISLDVYSQATNACRETIAQDFLKILGPDHPTEDACEDNPGALSCTVRNLNSTLTAAQALHDKYGYEDSNPNDSISGIQSSSDSYSETFNKLECSSFKLQKILNPTDETIAPDRLPQCTDRANLTSIDRGIADQTSLKGRVSSAKTTLDQMQTTLNVLAATYRANLAMENDAQYIKSQLCAVALADRTHVNDLEKDALRNALYALDGSKLRDCPGMPPSSTIGAALSDLRLPNLVPLTTKLSEQKGSFDQLLAPETGNIPVYNGSGELTEIKLADIRNIEDQLQNIDESLDNLSTVVNELGEGDSAQASYLKDLNNNIAAFQAAIEDAKETASLDVQKDLDAINKILTGTRNSANILLADRNKLGKDADTLLQNVAANMVQSSGTMTESGKQILLDQSSSLEGNYGASKTAIEEALGQIGNTFEKSSLNAQVVSDKLEGDIARVLADIGTPGERSGLLGMLGDATGRANAAGAQIGVAGQATSSFNSVQRAHNYGQQIRREQLRAGISKQKNMKAFMRDLPSSTRHTVTYSFTVSK